MASLWVKRFISRVPWWRMRVIFMYCSYFVSYVYVIQKYIYWTELASLNRVSFLTVSYRLHGFYKLIIYIQQPRINFIYSKYGLFLFFCPLNCSKVEGILAEIALIKIILNKVKPRLWLCLLQERFYRFPLKSG